MIFDRCIKARLCRKSNLIFETGMAPMSYLKLLANVTTRQKDSLPLLDNTIMNNSLRSRKAWLGVALTVCVLVSLLLVYLFASSDWIKAEPHDGNYHQLVSPFQLEVIQHLYPDGSKINKGLAAVQVRVFDEKSRGETVEQLNSEAAGVYFAVAEAGTLASGLQPIAKVLRSNDDHLYFFSVAEHYAQAFKAGQFVELEVGQNNARGKVHSVIRAIEQNSTNIGIQFEYPYDVAVLHPLASVRMKLSPKRSNGSVMSGEGR
ncbi:hypothetical protein J2X32_003718 [Rheinheimera pacifica]|uniref:hypothetical protein n=1 Tax=Rheinheimera pacifica TaxID=173990 RepID=UPI002855E7C9|nr:hypothetical protein [Rheinheimera pacifica]MDR6985062.1 hypothetical protein [Rheinheimera pacifica]